MLTGIRLIAVLNAAQTALLCCPDPDIARLPAYYGPVHVLFPASQGYCAVLVA